MDNGLAVELFFDPHTEARIMGLWEKVARVAVGPSMSDIGARPHISLAVFEEGNPDQCRVDLRSFAQEIAPIEVMLSYIGVFPSTGVVFIGVVVTDTLLGLNQSLYNCLTGMGIVSTRYYHPGNWVPHCTVATALSVEKIADVLDVCLVSDVLGPAHLVEIGLVEFRPAYVHYSFPLGGRG